MKAEQTPMTKRLFTKEYTIERVVTQELKIYIETDGTDEEGDQELAFEMAYEADDKEWETTYTDVLEIAGVTDA
jgi:hypothetical protein